MSHLPLSRIDRLNQTESAVFKCWQRISFQIIKVADKLLCYISAGNRVYCRPSLFNSFLAKLVKYLLQKKYKIISKKRKTTTSDQVKQYMAFSHIVLEGMNWAATAVRASKVTQARRPPILVAWLCM